MECSYKIYTRPAPAPPAKPKSHRPSYLRLLPDISDGLLEHESGRIVKKLEGAASIEKSDVLAATGMLGECVKRLKQKVYAPAQPIPEKEPQPSKPDGTWEDVQIRASYNWKMRPAGEPPKPQIEYFCPSGWEVQGAYSYDTGVPIPEYGVKCVPAEKP